MALNVDDCELPIDDPIHGTIRNVCCTEVFEALARGNTRPHTIAGYRYPAGSVIFASADWLDDDMLEATLCTMRGTYQNEDGTHEVHPRCDVVDDLIERGEWEDPLATRQA